MDYNMIGTAWSLLPPIVAIALALKRRIDLLRLQRQSDGDDRR